MSFPSDNSLDAQLRDVPVPPDLAARIRAALAPTDEQLDSQLRAVIVPETLTTHLLDIPSDLAIEEALADVAVPFTVVADARLATPAERFRRFGRSAARLAVAASWFLALSITLVGGAGTFLRSIYPQAESDGLERVMIYTGPLSVDLQLAGGPLDPAATFVALPLDDEAVLASSLLPASQAAMLSPANPSSAIRPRPDRSPNGRRWSLPVCGRWMMSS
jgi:hypothetical protein